MLDAIELEQRGIPSVPIGEELLVKVTGRAMARAQGYPDYPIAVIKHFTGALTSLRNEEEFKALAVRASQQIEELLLGRMPLI